jgi:integrase
MQGFTRQRGKTWTSYWSTTDPATGKRVQHSKGGFRTKREAQAHLTSTMPSVQAGTFKPDGKLTVRVLFEEWKAAKASEGLRPGTLNMYNDVIAGWLEPNIGGLKLTELSPKVAGELIAKLRSPEGSRHGRGPLSDRSVQLATTVLKSATRWASEQGVVGRDVLAGYKRPKIQPSDRVASAWTPDEAGQFLSAIADDRLRAAWWFLLARGPRRGEVCGLRWEDLDLEAGRLRIVHTRVMVDGKVTGSDPKTKAGRRSVSLDPQLVGEFRSHRKRQLEERLRAGEAWEDSGYVFTDELGRPVHPDTFSGRFDALIAKAGVRRVRLHDGRHSAATMMLEGGTPVHTVSQILGHSKPSITLDVYAHAVDRGGEVAGEQLTRLLSSHTDTEAGRAKGALT